MSLFGEGVDELDGFFEEWDEVVCEEHVTIFEYFTYKFPCMHTILQIIFKVLNILNHHFLILCIVPHEFKEENVALFENT